MWPPRDARNYGSIVNLERADAASWPQAVQFKGLLVTAVLMTVGLLGAFIVVQSTAEMPPVISSPGTPPPRPPPPLHRHTAPNE
jgi:hypothetical protein